MQPYRLTPEMLWKSSPEVEAARRHEAWPPFHRRCGEAGLFFDLPSPAGRAGFTIVAFRSHTHRAGGFWNEKLSEGKAKTVFGALEAAFRASGVEVPAAEPLLDRMLGRVADGDDFDELLNDDFEGLL